MARTRWPPICEPRPLPQARQIGPAAPVGAKAGVRPTERYQDNPRRRRPIRRSGRTQARPYAHTTENPRKQGRTTIHILPADSARLIVMDFPSRSVRRSSAYVCPVIAYCCGDFPPLAEDLPAFVGGSVKKDLALCRPERRRVLEA